MPTRYFRLTDDVSIPGRWELGVPVAQQGRELDDPWMFKNGVPVHVDGRLKVPIKTPGKPLDFSLAGIGVGLPHLGVDYRPPRLRGAQRGPGTHQGHGDEVQGGIAPPDSRLQNSSVGLRERCRAWRMRHSPSACFSKVPSMR